MTQTEPFSQRLRVAHLNPRQPVPVTLAPDKATRQAIAADLGLIALPALRLTGELRAEGGDAWVFDGRIEARVVQECVVTLAPVDTALSEPVRRVFSPHLRPPEETEVEMPDDEVEPLGAFIDLGAIATEALALALPAWPRADDAQLPDAAQDADPDDTDAGDQRRPFAGLADLLAKRDD